MTAQFRRRAGILAAGVAAVLWLAPPAEARPFQLGPGREGTRPRPEDRDLMRDDIQETIEIYMVARLKRFLALTEDQERVVIPLIEELNASRREMNRGRRLSLMKLRPLIQDETASDQEIGRLVSEMDDRDRQFRDQELRTRDKIRAALSPRQQGQFVVFMERFRQEMEDRVRRLQQNDGPPGPRP